MPATHPSSRRAPFHAFTAATLAVLATLAAPRPLAAQSPVQPASSLPSELVSALFTGFAAPDSRYFVGVVPPGWPAEIQPPAGTSVVGGMQTGRRLVAVFADSIGRHPLDGFRSVLERAGWVRPPIVREPGFESGRGFENDDGLYPFWCRDSLTAMTTALRQGAMTYVRASLDRVMTGRCGAPPTRPSRPASALTLPPLPPPSGIHSTSSHSGMSNDELSANTRLADSTMSAAAVLSHYTSLLARAGWTAFPPTASTGVAAQVLEVRDKDGLSWHGVLIVVPSATARDVTLMMTRLSSP